MPTTAHKYAKHEGKKCLKQQQKGTVLKYLHKFLSKYLHFFVSANNLQVEIQAPPAIAHFFIIINVVPSQLSTNLNGDICQGK